MHPNSFGQLELARSPLCLFFCRLSQLCSLSLCLYKFRMKNRFWSNQTAHLPGNGKPVCTPGGFLTD